MQPVPEIYKLTRNRAFLIHIVTHSNCDVHGRWEGEWKVDHVYHLQAVYKLIISLLHPTTSWQHRPRCHLS